MLAHGELLVSLNFQVGTWAGGAEENESCCAVLGIVGDGVARVELSCTQKPSGTGQAASLMTDGRQFDSGLMGCVPDVLILCDIELPY